MSARPQERPPTLRPYLPADEHVLAVIFRDSIQELASEDYSEGQLAAWSGAADDKEFAVRLASQTTLIALMDGTPAGFISLKGLDHIDMLYVHPNFVRRGVGNALCDALETIAAARGVEALTVEATDNARPFFDQRGYTAEIRKLVPSGDEWLGETTMKKRLPKREAGRLQ